MIHQGDCLCLLKTFESESIDSLVTDPPAGISFMGKDWDTNKGGRKEWIEWLSLVMKECLRVMKPGAHGLVWAIPRTSHWTATALEDAGFEVRDVITHLFGSGFPKSLDISKAIDKAAGAEREVVGPSTRHGGGKNNVYGEGMGDGEKTFVTAPATPEAKQWQGWGTALKPASEHWVLIRKPISEKTVAANVLKHGTGGINIDASRVGIDGGKGEVLGQKTQQISHYEDDKRVFGTRNTIDSDAPRGRFPANLVLSHNPDCVEVGTKKMKSSKEGAGSSTSIGGHGAYSGASAQLTKPGYASEDGTETVAAFECTPRCAVAELDRQSLAGGMHSAGSNRSKGYAKQTNDGALFGIGNHEGNGMRFGDSGGASRFFYVAKASKSDKNAGCEGLPEVVSGVGDERPSGQSMQRLDGREPRKIQNHHPTVKSTKLMNYLITMITPPGGIVLDPFMGSGTTGVSAVQNGFQFVGIEQDPNYIQIAEKRIYHALPNFRKDVKL